MNQEEIAKALGASKIEIVAQTFDDVNTWVPQGRVVYLGADDDQARWESCDDPRPLLEVGEDYTLSAVEVHSWHTKVSLVGVKGKFNSVCFKKLNPENAA